jgi:hypothetical protein
MMRRESQVSMHRHPHCPALRQCPFVLSVLCCFVRRPKGLTRRPWRAPLYIRIIVREGLSGRHP